MRARGAWVAHDTAASVDALLAGRVPDVQLRCAAGAGPSPAGSLDSGEFAWITADSSSAAGAGASADSSSSSGSGSFSAASSSVARQVSASTISYDCVEDVLAAEGVVSPPAGGSGSGSRSSSGAGGLPTEAELLALASAAAAAAGGSAAGSLTAAGDALGELPGADPRVWVERLKALPEEEAMRQLALLRYVGGDAGLMRPRARGGFMGASGASAAPHAAAGGGGGKKKAAKRGAAARAARR
jgi:hypothetical protein